MSQWCQGKGKTKVMMYVKKSDDVRKRKAMMYVKKGDDVCKTRR